ncbi:MAG TPA: transporter [Clostridiales bacterium]|nr:transporter [Clostridiales bacterium]
MKFFKSRKSTLVKLAILLFLVTMLLFPGCAFRGASSGLLLWFNNVLPSLLPFIIVSNLIVRLNITRHISRVFYPVFGKIFGISREGCYPVVIGFLSGIPMGAKAAADLEADRRISMEEGQFLMSMCNNASPMFIIGYISITQLELPEIKYALFAIIFGSAIIGAFIYRLLVFLRKPRRGKLQAASLTRQEASMDTAAPLPGKAPRPGSFRFEMLDSSIMNGFEIVTRIGGYIILFSILAQIMKESLPSSGIVKAFAMGILEITTGISQICSTAAGIKTKIVLIAALTSFGGLSGIAQTKSVLQGSRLSIRSYLYARVIVAIVAFLLAVIYVNTLFTAGYH